MSTWAIHGWMGREVPASDSGRRSDSGLGALCREAQADGVPCAELGVECRECGRAVLPSVVGAVAEPMRPAVSIHWCAPVSVP